MHSSLFIPLTRVVCLLTLLAGAAKAQISAPIANDDPSYQALRHAGIGRETINVSSFTLKREAGIFTFRNGTFFLFSPVNGRVTGALFKGDGIFTLEPPLPSEMRNLKLLTREPEFSEHFAELVIRFTDDTLDQLKRASAATQGATTGAPLGYLGEVEAALRGNLHYNLSARILQDILSSRPGGLFLAFINGKRYSGKLLYMIDPHGVPRLGGYPGYLPDMEVAPEEVALLTYDENRFGVWASFHLAAEYASGQAKSTQQNRVIEIQKQQLDTTIEKSGKLDAAAVTTFVTLDDGVRTVPFDLFRKLRVQKVTAGDGTPLRFIQEDRDQDWDYWAILPRELKRGETFSIKTEYSGKEAVLNEGGGNYFPIARTNWYPSTTFGDYAEYEMTFHIPRGMKMVATGALLEEKNEGDWNVSRWNSEVPQAVAGFNFGRMKRTEAKLSKPEYLVESYANEDQPDWIRNIVHATEDAMPVQGSQRTLIYQPTLGNMNTTDLMKKALAEGQLSIQLFSDYYGAPSYKRTAITQQVTCNFGQSWPDLVYLPLCSFLDDTTRHQLFRNYMGLDPFYFKVVTAHEVAHQWWGHAVGFNSYRDQWMSEGFAEFSAALYLQVALQNMEDYRGFWAYQHRLLTEKNQFGFRPVEVGALTLGYRLNTSRTGFDVAQNLIYPKGAFVLHMLRMMMWSPQTGDATFKAMMHDFVSKYMNHPVSTEDFKSTVEKHMTQEMDVLGNRRMDWFFDHFVYGTTLPNYDFRYSLDRGSDGATVLSVKLTQSNVDGKFRMLVPLYLEMANGSVIRLGAARIEGNGTIEQQIPLGVMKDKPKRATINYYYDVLCTQSAN